MLKIIISPAKKMRILEDYSCRLSAPVFQEKAGQLHTALRNLSFEELKKLWNCSEKLAVQNYERLHAWVPGRHLTPALLAYEGIQYQYMAPHIFSESQWTYAEEHLRILSGFYGILRPTDGVIPYRLEMQAKLAPVRKAFGSVNSLYEYWGDSIYRHLAAETPADIDALQSTGPAAKTPADADALQSAGPAAKTPADADALQSA
ncbi:MAG: YaaA family protein, partial [Ruminococcus sp.]|nr:YaaA family protein [Ruminococcus sp.]